MELRRRHGVAYVAIALAAFVGYTLAYAWGMATFEGEPVSLLHSFHIVVETFTTVGYGEDAPWSSPLMTALVVAMQLTGVSLVFLTLPLFVAPWLERRMRVTPPTAVDLSDHVVVCGLTPHGESLTDELDARDVDHVVLTGDAERARALHEAGRTVVHGDPESTDALESACVADARAVVLDEGDETNATVALSVRELAPDVRTVALLEDPSLGTYIDLAGVDHTLSPRDLLGHALAESVTSSVESDLGETVDIGRDFQVAELPIRQGSPLDGVRLADSRIRDQTDAQIIGAWFGAEFVPSPDPDAVLDHDTVLLAAGSERQLTALNELTLARRREHARESVVVAGYGEVGHAVRDELDDAGVTTTVVDERDVAGVNVVGDATDEATLRQAGLEEASALILCLGDDTTAIFTTLVARDLAPDVEVLSRANEVESQSKLYRAGADFVISLASVSGRMLTSTVLGEDVISLETRVELVRTEAPDFVGQTLAGADVRSRTGCTVVAVERGGEVLTSLGPDFRIEEGDALVIAGADEDVSRFTELAGAHASTTRP